MTGTGQELSAFVWHQQMPTLPCYDTMVSEWSELRTKGWRDPGHLHPGTVAGLLAETFPEPEVRVGTSGKRLFSLPDKTGKMVSVKAGRWVPESLLLSSPS